MEFKQYLTAYFIVGAITLNFFFVIRMTRVKKDLYEDFTAQELYVIYIFSVIIWPVILVEILRSKGY